MRCLFCAKGTSQAEMFAFLFGAARESEITDFVLYQLHSGATLNEITGAYHKNPQKEMITIVDKHEYRKLMDFVKETDPKAFVTVYAVNEICYQPKL